jgi:hypothetical protein
MWPDNDLAGARAAINVATELRRDDFRIVIPDSAWPEGYDIADAIAGGMAPEQIDATIAGAVPLAEFERVAVVRWPKLGRPARTSSLGCQAKLQYQPPSPDFTYDKFNAPAMLAEVQRRFAYLKEMDNIADLDDYIIRSKDGFAGYAAKYNAMEPDQDNPDKWRKVNTAARWLESPERIELLSPVYEPGLPTPICEIDGVAHFNLWRGFNVEPQKGDIRPFTRILNHVFEGMPEEKAHYLGRHSYARQHPGEKIMHAQMLISRVQGIGKSLLGEMIGYGLWGERNFSEVEHGHLGTGFNSYLKHKKFILANEMLLSSSSAADKRKDANQLKNAITRDRVEINEKFIRQYFVRDILYWDLTSNFNHAVWLDREDDHRLHIARLKQVVPLSKRFGADCGEKAKAWAQSREGAAALNYFFLNYPCKGFAPKAAPPITVGQQITYEMGLTTLDKFVRDLVEDSSCLAAWPKCDFVRLDEVRRAFLTKYPNVQTISDQAIGSAIAHFGGVYLPDKIQWSANGKQHELRVWALRHGQYWLAASKEARRAHFLDPVNNQAPK